MPEYVNPNSYTIHLLGPDGRQIAVRSRQKVVLNEYFDRYISRGFIKKTNSNTPIQPKTPKAKIQSKVKLTAKQQKINKKPQVSKAANKAREIRKQKKDAINKARKISHKSLRRKGNRKQVTRHSKTIVGRKLAVDATKLLHDNLDKNIFPISNNIGVGILSYNRKDCLKRLVDSIIKNTDLRKTTVFISDDGSTDPATIEYLNRLGQNPNVVVICNKENIGVAGNSNRLIRCLSRFKYGLILNDDIEVLKPGWDRFYVEAIKKTGIHHFQYREIGVYGAKPGDLIDKGDFHIRKVDERPHGAVLAFTREMLVKCGYFNESYGKYGMEHVDWSMKPAEFDMQDSGFFDVEGSDQYFKLHDDKSSVDQQKSTYLKDARKTFKERDIGHRIGPTPRSMVPEITYVIPFRNTDRQDSIVSVVNNIRAQRFPVIHIIIVEQDTNTRININRFKPITYYLQQDNQPLFNKSRAFNLGVSKALTNKIVLHDADMLVLSNYTAKISKTLDIVEGCHLGGTVIYTSQSAMQHINNTGVVDTGTNCERVIGYFEGGSLACTRSTFWKIGGFNEDYNGYGCEDCDFYARLSRGAKWREERVFDFLHLWHGRVEGWDQHHSENKSLEHKLSQLSIDQRINMQRSQLKKLGYEE